MVGVVGHEYAAVLGDRYGDGGVTRLAGVKLTF